MSKVKHMSILKVNLQCRYCVAMMDWAAEVTSGKVGSSNHCCSRCTHTPLLAVSIFNNLIHNYLLPIRNWKFTSPRSRRVKPLVAPWNYSESHRAPLNINICNVHHVLFASFFSFLFIVLSQVPWVNSSILLSWYVTPLSEGTVLCDRHSRSCTPRQWLMCESGVLVISNSCTIIKLSGVGDSCKRAITTRPSTTSLRRLFGRHSRQWWIMWVKCRLSSLLKTLHPTN